MKTETTIDDIILWLGRIFGVLNLPIATISAIDLSTAVIMRVVPQTLGQWIGFLTAITVLAGVTAGLTVKRSYSSNRKIAHLMIAAFGLMLISNEIY